MSRPVAESPQRSLKPISLHNDSGYSINSYLSGTYSVDVYKRQGGQTLVALLAPVDLSSGYTVTLYDGDTEVDKLVDNTPVRLAQGGKVDTAEAEKLPTQLLFCGNNTACVIEGGSEPPADYLDAVV